MYEFVTKGMSCGNCVKHVTRAVKAVDPAADVQVDLEHQKITLKSNESEQSLISAIEDAGYPILQAKKV